MIVRMKQHSKSLKQIEIKERKTFSKKNIEKKKPSDL